MKPRHIVLGAALIGAAALVAFGDKGADTGIAEPAERPAARAALLPVVRTAAARTDQTAQEHAGEQGGAGAKGQQILALVPRDTLIGDGDLQFAQGQHGASGSDAPFGHQDWTPPPPPPPPAPAAAPPPPPPPAAPPLPFTVIGKAVANGVWEVYLARGDRTYVVHDKEVIDGIYRVEAIAPPLMTLTYLPLKQIQQLNIGVFD
jgi:hypothetical protein